MDKYGDEKKQGENDNIAVNFYSFYKNKERSEIFDDIENIKESTLSSKNASLGFGSSIEYSIHNKKIFILGAYNEENDVYPISNSFYQIAYQYDSYIFDKFNSLKVDFRRLVEGFFFRDARKLDLYQASLSVSSRYFIDNKFSTKWTLYWAA